MKGAFIYHNIRGEYVNSKFKLYLTIDKKGNQTFYTHSTSASASVPAVLYNPRNLDLK